MIDKLKNYLKTSKIFWKYRHLIDKNVWQSYAADGLSKRREYYSSHINNTSSRTVFEFGCASGPNLVNIRSKCDAGVKFYGFDINKNAIQLADANFSNVNTVFKSKLELSDLISQLAQWEAHYFDLAIYDRVLYLLDEREVMDHFSKYRKVLKFILIDDFHNSDRIETNGAYFTKDYIRLLGNLGFDLVEYGNSEHLSLETFFKQNAKRLLFINQNLKENK